MIIPDKIKVFLANVQDVSLGYREINFFSSKKLMNEQLGYRFDLKGNSLITGKPGDWQDEWLVIASDDLGDPIIVDTSLPDLPVLTAMYGEGIWESEMIADNLDKLETIISMLNKLSKGRTSPVDLEANPISSQEAKTILTEIEKQNPNSEIGYWISIFE